VSVKQSSAYCNVCLRQSLFQKPKINHILHLILSIVALGFWVFVWITLAIINATKPVRCVTCGSAPGSGPVVTSPQLAGNAPL
jgi:hypothetical protein